MFFNFEAIQASLSSYKDAGPFDHCVVDDFFKLEVAEQLESEFLSYEDPRWFHYKNSIEDKKALNDWNLFPSLTYQIFRALMDDKFIALLSSVAGVPLYADQGLHGGGWHIHGTGGNLNPHLDYSLHPKIGLQRKLNIIMYMSESLVEEHGGHLGLWSHCIDENGPGKLERVVQPKFNRAVIFDTTQNSWHGMCRPLVQPRDIYRKSLAIYYLTEPPIGVDSRQRALFAPRNDQKGDSNVADLIKRRADSTSFSSVYRDGLK